jgi:hypothetical protein
MPRVRIQVDKNGNAKILDVTGAGTNCVEATKNFEKMLGQVKEDTRTLTESYYELPEQTLEQSQEGE